MQPHVAQGDPSSLKFRKKAAVGGSRRDRVARPKRRLAVHVDQYQTAPIAYPVGCEYPAPATSAPRSPKESGVHGPAAVPEIKHRSCPVGHSARTPRHPPVPPLPPSQLTT
eukprot:574033-Prymnesium_polylepis.1